MVRRVHPPEMIEEIGRLWRGTQSTSEIGAAFGLTRNAILGIVTRYRIREGEALWPFRGPSGKRQPRPKGNGGQAGASHYATPRRVLANPILWLDRERRQCAWIEDDPADRPIDELQCCGAPVVEAGSSWCAFHGAIVAASPEELARSRRAGGFRLMPLAKRAA